MKSTSVLYKVNSLQSDNENWTYHSVHLTKLYMFLLKPLDWDAGIMQCVIFFSLFFIYLQEEFNFVTFQKALFCTNM